MQSSKTVPAEILEQLRADREAIAAELPEAIQRAERLREAAAENTVSGRVRRAVHQSRRPLDAIAAMRAYPSNCYAIGLPATGPFAPTCSTALPRPSEPKCRSHSGHVDSGPLKRERCTS